MCHEMESTEYRVNKGRRKKNKEGTGQGDFNRFSTYLWENPYTAWEGCSIQLCRCFGLVMRLLYEWSLRWLLCSRKRPDIKADMSSTERSAG